MGKRLIDVGKLHAVLLEEREYWKDEGFEAVSECARIVNHFPEYDESNDFPTLTVSYVMHHLLRTSTAKVVLKREDNGREYTKIKDSLDDKNDWQVTGFMPRIKTGSNYAYVEIVLWCKDRNADIKELHTDLVLNKE